MRILDRYLIKGFVYPLLYCLLLFFMMFVIIDIFNNLDEFLKHAVPLTIILYYYACLLPAILAQVVPIATLVAILYVLGHLNKHNEIIALKASGISVFHILSPYLFTGILLSFSIFLMNETIAPRAMVTSTAIMEGLIQKGKKNLEERAIKNATLVGGDNRMIFAREFEVSGGTLHDVILLQDNPNQALESKLVAKKGHYENGSWTFYDTMRYQMNRRGDMVGEPTYAQELKVDMAEKPEDFIREASQVEFMSAKQLKEYIRRLKGSSHKLIQRLWVDFHYKLAFPFVNLVVMLIGAPLAMRTARGSAMLGIGTSLAIVFLYYGMASICLALGKGGTIAPFLSAWFSNFLFAFVGIYLIKHSA